LNSLGEGRGALLLVFVLQFVFSVLAAWALPSPAWNLPALAAVFAASSVAYRRILNARASRARRIEETEEKPTPVIAAPEEAAPPTPRRRDASWDELKKACQEAEGMLAGAPRADAFVEVWISFGESLDHLRGNSKSILENSKKAFDISDNLAGTAEKAFALSEQVQAKVKELTGELAASLTETRRLAEESKKIVGILEMMSDISSKTYVLSINASIVATRAGIHGKAFDVVAKEIRKLAQETESSLKNIEEFVGHIQEIVQKVVDHTTITASEIEKEKESLLSVAGALQGVILAVEIIRTVSNLSKEKAQEQQAISDEVISRTREVAGQIQSESSGGDVDAIRDKIRRLMQILDRMQAQ
jgi:ubiquinone biosynthesis protein UbiJ